MAKATITTGNGDKVTGEVVHREDRTTFGDVLTLYLFALPDKVTVRTEKGGHHTGTER